MKKSELKQIIKEEINKEIELQKFRKKMYEHSVKFHNELGNLKKFLRQKGYEV